MRVENRVLSAPDASSLFCVGLLLGEIANRFANKAKKSIQPQSLKYYAYSAVSNTPLRYSAKGHSTCPRVSLVQSYVEAYLFQHDTTIIAQLENFGAYDGILPPYASALLYELHEKTPGKFTVEVRSIGHPSPWLSSLIAIIFLDLVPERPRGHSTV